jgi:HD-like signal output (HDOD) protein
MSFSGVDVAGRAGSVPRPELPLDPETRKTADKLCNLPPFQSVATKILHLSSSQTRDVQPVVRLIESEPAFSADVLRLANSPIFGLASRVHSVGHAVVLLGIERMKTIAFRVASQAFLQSALKLPVVRQCWVHSLACAELAEEIAPICGIAKDRAYTAGLMHDIGRLGLLKAYPKEYVRLLSAAQQTVEANLRAEQCLFGMDHCTAGFWLTKVWSFPQELSELARRHHDPEARGDRDLLWLVQLCCVLANSLEFEAIAHERPPAVEEVVREFCRDARQAPSLLPDALKARIRCKIQSLEA